MTTTAPAGHRPRRARLEDGRVVAIAGPVVDVEFPPHALPEINHAVEIDLELEGPPSHGDGRGRPADRRGPGALRLHAGHRRPGPGRGRAQHRDRHLGAGRRRRARPRVQRPRPSARHRRHRAGGRPLGDPPQRPGLRPARARALRCSRPASRWSTCSSPTCRAARSVSSAARASARRSSSKR